MKQIITIPRYEKVEETFRVIGEDQYTITYLNGKTGRLRVIVNGFLTRVQIQILNPSQGYKKALLSAIAEYINRDRTKTYNSVARSLSLDGLKHVYKKSVISNVQNYLLTINKEVNRDTLTELKIYKPSGPIIDVSGSM